MRSTTQTVILRADAAWLILVSATAMLVDVAGAFLERGPESAFLGGHTELGIAFLEAHGLALILGITLWRVPVSRGWHVTAAALHLLLGTSNLLFWNAFFASGMATVGYVTTSFHLMFVLVQIFAAFVLGFEEERVSSFEI